MAKIVAKEIEWSQTGTYGFYLLEDRKAKVCKIDFSYATGNYYAYMYLGFNPTDGKFRSRKDAEAWCNEQVNAFLNSITTIQQ